MHELRSAILSGAGVARATPVAPKRRLGHGSSLVGIPVRREESRLTNQRREDRLPGVIGSAVLTFRRRKHEARVVNLSSTGMMAECAIEPRIGERLGLDLGEAGRGKCVVRWIRGSRLGLEFDGFSLRLGRSDSGDFVFQRHEDDRPKQARAPRQALAWPASIHAGGETTAVRIRNISPAGALLESERDLPAETAVMLDLSGAGMVTGTVRWCEDGHIGVKFDRDFDLRALSACAQETGETTHATWLKPEYLETELEPDSPWAARWEKLTLADLG